MHSDLVLVVTADDTLHSAELEGTVIYADARDKQTWPVLAQLDVPLALLPRAYVLRDTPLDWMDRPTHIPASRITIIPLTTSFHTTNSPPPGTPV